jgi:hypothetical protein
MRVNPEGPAAMLCEWLRSITAITNRMNVTNLSRRDSKRQVDASDAAPVVKCRTDTGTLIPEVGGRRQELEGRKPAGRIGAVRSLAVSIPRTKGSQIRVSHEPKEIGQLRDVQLAVLIPIGHLEFGFEKA